MRKIHFAVATSVYTIPENALAAEAGMAAVRIERYEFRTRASGERQVQAEIATVA